MYSNSAGVAWTVERSRLSSAGDKQKCVTAAMEGVRISAAQSDQDVKPVQGIQKMLWCWRKLDMVQTVSRTNDNVKYVVAEHNGHADGVDTEASSGIGQIGCRKQFFNGMKCMHGGNETDELRKTIFQWNSDATSTSLTTCARVALA